MLYLSLLSDVLDSSIFCLQSMSSQKRSLLLYIVCVVMCDVSADIHTSANNCSVLSVIELCLTCFRSILLPSRRRIYPLLRMALDCLKSFIACVFCIQCIMSLQLHCLLYLCRPLRVVIEEKVFLVSCIMHVSNDHCGVKDVCFLNR